MLFKSIYYSDTIGQWFFFILKCSLLLKQLDKNSIFYELSTDWRLTCVSGSTTLAQQRSISSKPSRRNRLPAGKSEVLDFSCPEDFGYYQHPTDCTQYYVCVFGGALQEACSGGLVYRWDIKYCVTVTIRGFCIICKRPNRGSTETCTAELHQVNV